MMLDESPNQGALYSYELGEPLRPLIERVSISNGIDWNYDGSIMYYIDSPRRKIRAYDYDLETGNLSNERTIVRLSGSGGSGQYGAPFSASSTGRYAFTMYWRRTAKRHIKLAFHIGRITGIRSWGGLALLKNYDRVRIDLNAFRVDVLIDEEELRKRREHVAKQPDLVSTQTPWQEFYRKHTGQLSTGGCLEFATNYLQILQKRGKLRHSH